MVALWAGCNFTTVRGSGNIVSEERTVPDRAGMSVCCGFHLRLDVGSERSFEITGDDNILERVQVVGRGGRLVVEPTNSSLSFRPSEPVVVDVTLTDLDHVAVSGGGQARVEAFVADEVSATLSGGSTGTFKGVETDLWRPTVSGGGEITVQDGSTDRQRVQLSGGSTYKARQLASSRATVQASGGSQATVSVSDSLEATASGGSRIEYIGRPSVDAETSGGGTVRRIDP
jgi:hypothetical protein